jgi:hypothetical protein
VFSKIPAESSPDLLDQGLDHPEDLVERFAFERRGAVLDLFGVLHPGPSDERLLLLPGTSTAWASTGWRWPPLTKTHETKARSPLGSRGSKLRPMRRTPVFGDPKTGFVFQRVFGSEDHMTALLGFLNDILQLDEPHRITSVVLLPPEQRPKVSDLKSSIVDVKCVDAAGTTYVVEMQVFNVEEFEKRVVYNVAKAYTNQLGVGFAYPELDDVIGITICNFELWPRKQAPHV